MHIDFTFHIGSAKSCDEFHSCFSWITRTGLMVFDSCVWLSAGNSPLYIYSLFYLNPFTFQIRQEILSWSYFQITAQSFITFIADQGSNLFLKSIALLSCFTPFEFLVQRKTLNFLFPFFLVRRNSCTVFPFCNFNFFREPNFLFESFLLLVLIVSYCIGRHYILFYAFNESLLSWL